MKLKALKHHFTICQIVDMSAVDWNAPFCFAARTDEECSLVCPQEYVPADAIRRDDGWRALRIEGVLDFSLIGILARISSLLAQNEIPVFAVSTYNPDYSLVKQEKWLAALDVLSSSGYDIE